MLDKNTPIKHWELKKLGEVANYINGRAFKPKEWETKGAPIIRIQNLNKPDLEFNYSTNEFEEKYKVEKGDLLFAWAASLGVFFWTGEKAWLNQHIFKVVPKDFCNKRFLFYFLDKISADLYSKAHGSGMVHVTKGIFESTIIPLPPISVQQQIVAKIEELFSELDIGKQQLETAKQQIKTYRQAVLKWAFEGRFTNENVKDGELPEGWRWLKVSEIGKIETGNTPSKKNPKYYSNDFPFYKPTDLEAAYNVRSASDNLSAQGIKEARFLPENSILVTCIGATIGKSGIIRKAGASNQQINAIIPYKQFNPNFVYYQAIAPIFQDSIRENASSTTLPILNKTKFMNLEMIYCPFEEQELIVREIETRLSVCDKMEETIDNCLQQTESLQQSILKQAFEGKLV